MKRSIPLIIINLFFLLTLVQCDEITEKNKIVKTLKFTDSNAQTKTLFIDNINGSVDVTGYDGDVVELVVHETFIADSKRKLEEAKNEVTVEIKEEGDRISLYVDGPWRRSNGSCDYRGYDYYGYEVKCDFTVKVPRKTDVKLKTVNDGNIKAENIEGDFSVQNVNGGIKLHDMNGSGKVNTVNGKIDVTFKTNPTEESSFKTVNGEVSVKFRDNLTADLEFKTLNGEVYSDFEMQSLPVKSHSMKRRGGMKVYKSGDLFSVRVGKGGPELSFNTLNGDITISKYK